MFYYINCDIWFQGGRTVRPPHELPFLNTFQRQNVRAEHFAPYNFGSPTLWHFVPWLYFVQPFIMLIFPPKNCDISVFWHFVPCNLFWNYATSCLYRRCVCTSGWGCVCVRTLVYGLGKPFGSEQQTKIVHWGIELCGCPCAGCFVCVCVCVCSEKTDKSVGIISEKDHTVLNKKRSCLKIYHVNCSQKQTQQRYTVHILQEYLKKWGLKG